MLVNLQPCGRKDSATHYNNTVINSIPLKEIKQFISQDDYDKLIKIYPDGEFYAWGVRNGTTNYCYENYSKLKIGDFTLFEKTIDGIAYIISYAKITHLLDNYNLAKYLWNKNTTKKEDVFEHIIFLDKIKLCKIEFTDILKMLEYSDNFRLTRFIVCNSYVSNKIIQDYNLITNSASTIQTNTISYNNNDPIDYDTKIKKIVNELENPSLDKQILAKQREEQTLLRKFLFGDKQIDKCGICGKSFPIDLLTTSHIKRRCDCTLEEKLDYKNIVMPMCNCGCDKAFENGYIYVNDNGKICLNKDKILTDSFIEIYNDIIGKQCEYFNENTKKYFKAHRNRFGIE